MINPRKKQYSYALFFVFLLVYSIVYYSEVITWMSVGLHDWGQSDRFSLARSFYDNGFNFFKPATNNLLPVDGITGVEFPIQAYLAACLAYIFGRENMHICFRALDILIVWAGLFYLFRITFKRTGDFIFSIVPPLFVFSAPVFIYYGGNFLPDPAGASISFIALYYFIDYFKEGKRKDLILSAIFFTLAALIKTTIAIYLISSLGFVFFRSISSKNWKDARSVFIAGLLSFGVLLSWFLYTRYLNHKYQSELFLAAPQPFRSFDEIIAYTEHWFKHKWINEYLLLPQYIFLAMVVVPSVYLWRLQKRKAVLTLAVIYLCIVLAWICVMGHPILIHDYYMIATFFPFAAFLLCFSMLAVRREATNTVAIKSLRMSLLAAVLIMFFFADHHNHKRIQPRYLQSKEEYDKMWMYGGDKLLDSLRVPKDARIGALSVDAPNLALILFDRKGLHFPNYQWNHDINAITQAMKQKGATILVCHDSVANVYIQENPLYFQGYDTLAQSGNKMVFRMK